MSIDLDKRIIKGKKPLTAFDELESKYIGTDCFFSDKPSDFADLSKCQVGKLMSLDAVSGMFGASKNNSYAIFYFCLPLEWVKEPKKKYRPYSSVMEFIKYYPIGSYLHLRIKDDSMEMHRLIDGYNDYKNGNGTLFMCGTGFSMSELYENYEIFKDGEWKPFGVEE